MVSVHLAACTQEQKCRHSNPIDNDSRVGISNVPKFLYAPCQNVHNTNRKTL
jgi:hypothetical protein